MDKYNKILFVCMDNTSFSPMAEAYMKYISGHKDIEIISGGLVVLFSQPYNPKAVAAMRGLGIILENKTSRQLVIEDITEDSLVLTMGKYEKERLITEYNPRNVYTITEFVGEAGELFDPYGKEIESYVEFANSLAYLLGRVEEKLDLIKEV